MGDPLGAVTTPGVARTCALDLHQNGHRPWHFEHFRLQTATKGFARLEAMAHGLDKPEKLLGRILRHLAAWNTVREVGIDLFAVTPTSNAFLDAGAASGPDLDTSVVSRYEKST